MPTGVNGFSFIFADQYPTLPIPAEPYTGFFSRGVIPMAAPGQRYHQHDIGHVVGYQDMFGIEDFADLVRGAAPNALADPLRCRRFAWSVNGLGDAMFSIETSGFIAQDVQHGRAGLRELIEQQGQRPFDEIPGGQERLEKLWQDIGFAAAEEAHVRKIGHPIPPAILGIDLLY